MADFRYNCTRSIHFRFRLCLLPFCFFSPLSSLLSHWACKVFGQQQCQQWPLLSPAQACAQLTHTHTHNTRTHTHTPSCIHSSPRFNFHIYLRVIFQQIFALLTHTASTVYDIGFSHFTFSISQLTHLLPLPPLALCLSLFRALNPLHTLRLIRVVASYCYHSRLLLLSLSGCPISLTHSLTLSRPSIYLYLSLASLTAKITRVFLCWFIIQSNIIKLLYSIFNSI